MPEQVHSADALTDHVADVLHTRFPDVSLDSLLCAPFSAISLGLDTAVKAGRLTSDRANALWALLLEVRQLDEAAFEIVNEICRCAMAARKRSKLRKDRV